MDNSPRLPIMADLPRVVVFDLDGTLLDPSGTLRPRTRDAVNWLLEREVAVTLATARPLRSVRVRVGMEIVNRVSVVHMNGVGLVHRGASSTQAYRLPEEVASRVAALAASLAPSARVVCEIAGEQFGCDLAMDAETLWATNAATPDMVIPISEALSHGVVKIAVNGFGQSLTVLASAIEEELGVALTVIREASDSFLNILPPGTSKEAAVIRVLPGKSSWQGVLAFGDDLADAEMLRLAEFGVAMANAHPSVLAAARYRTYSNGEDGVAHALERLRADHG